jgi:phage terminase large subunit-like protein
MKALRGAPHENADANPLVDNTIRIGAANVVETYGGSAIKLQLALAAEMRASNRIRQYYPDEGPLRRDLYPKHMEFFRAGAEHRERLFIAGNRVGKTEGVSAYEMSCHLTGLYPPWWQGKRFSRAINAWAAGDTNQTVRDILQAKLLGRLSRDQKTKPGEAIGLGTGMIPRQFIRDTRPKSGMPNAVECVWVRHASGGISTLVFKSYEQGRKAFQGTEQDVIALDEEPPPDVYFECLTRTMRTGAFGGGMIILTFTPLNGWTDVVADYLDEDRRVTANRYYVQAGWDDAPHISQAEKEDMIRRYPDHQRDARTKGIPQLGVGAIYQIPESELAEKPFELPRHFPRVYALDPSWNRTAALWGALDPDSGTIHLYDEHYYAHMDASENARAIRERGTWIPGVIDPAARGRSQVDGQQLLENYLDLGLDLLPAINTREAGIQIVRDWMLAGKLKVFSSCTNWFKEFRLYRRDDKGQIVKKDDHLMDCTRYLMVSGRDRMRTPPVKKKEQTILYTPRYGGRGPENWMG